MNKKGRKWMSLILAGLMTASLSACGNSEPAVDTGSAQSETSVQDGSVDDGTEASEAGEKDGSDTGKYNVDWEDMVDIHMLAMSMGPVPAGTQAVEDAINAITEEEINVHVDLEIIEIGSYDQQIGLKMSSNEPVDLMITMPGGPAGYTVMRSQGQLMDISDVLAEYGQPILDTVGTLIEATTVDGSIYAVPQYGDYSSGLYAVMRTDVLEDLGLVEKAKNMTSINEYAQILDAVANSEKWSGLSPIVSSGHSMLILTTGRAGIGANNFSDIKAMDALGDTLGLVGVDPDGSDPTVQMYYGSEDYRALYELVTDWYNKGYVYKDAATDPSTGSDLIKTNVGFSFLTDANYGVEANQAVVCGMPVTCTQIAAYPINTNSCIKFTWAVTNTSKEPEAAVTFLSMMYTDARIANLLAWGIEGVDYEVVDGIACYIEGNENPAYHMNDYNMGNQFLVTPWEGNEANLREVTMELTKSSPSSAYLGFSCDTSSVANEISAVTTVLDEYRGQIETGVADDEIFQEFLDKLEASGVDKIIACYQEQLDAWLAQK